ncbi:MAG TPA: phenylalanine--tRNA ligase subunit beta [Wenzhouxiangella sp.]|nr:phenylalanine--tRNA ligase subunit beta [Wenzhouxiangella sp.]
MKINYQWLKSWVPTELDAQDVADRFTLAGLEVDECSPVAPPLDGVVVGLITDIHPHPDADRLRVCTVSGDVQERSIVCGAPNAAKGLKVPLATLGTVLPGGVKIKPAKLRGIASEGMLCSSPELGLGEDKSGLMELPSDAEVGQSLSDYLGLDDHVLDIDLTPNRADCLSVRGLARELSALTDIPVKGPHFEPVDSTIDDSIEINLHAPADCPCYLGRVIRDVDVAAPTPLWMVESLRRCGIRSLGPIVDVTNYVLLELGQPMHAFDLTTLDGGIHVRRAKPGERMVLLDERDVELDPDMLLICDESKPLAIGGVIGGLESAVSAATQDILLESAWFDPATIVGRARRLGLATESAHRFERGVDPALQRQAMERASELILAIAGGAPGPVVETLERDHLPGPKTVPLRPERVNRLLGTDFSSQQIVALLKRLAMTVDDACSDSLRVTAPTARRDIDIEVDLIEEVARLTGYDNLPSRSPGGRLRLSPVPEAQVGLRTLARQLSARGFQEIVTWSFVSNADLVQLGLEKGAQPLANPLNRDMAVLRTSLLPGLLKTAASNFRRQHGSFRLFELGTCFLANEGEFREPQRLSLLMTGRISDEHPDVSGRCADFFDLKGEVEQLLRLNSVTGQLRCERSEQSWLHPGQGTDLYLDDQFVGSLGQLHPSLAATLDAQNPVFVAELTYRIRDSRLPTYQPGSRYPAVRRDIAVVIKEETPAADIIAEIRANAGKLFQRCVIFDEYRGSGIESGHKSLAMGLILRDVSRTLKDEEVERVMGRVVEGLRQRFAAELRG